MHIFLYEWITGGGLVEHGSRLPASLLAEGSAMITALAADFAAIEDARVTVLRDSRLDELRFPGCEIVEVESNSQWGEEFDRLAAAADRTMVVAPEFDAILLTTLQRLHQAGGRSLNAGREFVQIAGDKQRTVERLLAAGVPAPHATLLEADVEKLPADFEYPGVLKPLDGAGSQHTLLVDGPQDEPPPYPWPRRLERYCPGWPASVAALCGPNSRVVLTPCWQHLSADGRFTYQGGALITDEALARRATALASQALDAMPPAQGYVGVDLVLGDHADARDDVVIEINPRLTTSYVGLRAATKQNLAEALLRVADGQRVQVRYEPGELEFSATGDVRRTSARL